MYTSKVPTFCSCVRYIKLCVQGERAELSHIPSRCPQPGSRRPIAMFYRVSGCSLRWLSQRPCGRAALGTLIFSGLSPAQGCPVCEDARTPSPVLPITHHLKGLAFCLGSCKGLVKLKQLKFSHTAEDHRKYFCFFFFFFVFLCHSVHSRFKSF